MIVRGDAFFHEREGALPFSGMSSSSALRLELLEQHRRVVADARVRERGELVRIGAAEERVHPFPHPGAARDAQRERAAEDPTQDMNRPEPSGDEPLDLSEPEDLGESGPFEERSAPRTKADLLREIRQRADRRTGQQEAEQRQIDPWQVQPPQRRGHGR